MSKLGWMFVCMALLSCEKDTVNPGGAFSKGVFICNEGPFMSGTGTITHFNPETSGVTDDIYYLANGSTLGNIVQSMEVFNGRGYIMVNNANKAVVVELDSFKNVATINGLTLPRKFLPINDLKAYISCWDNSIAVVNLQSNKVMAHIPAESGAENMLRLGWRVFVLNQGGFGIDSTVTIIDAENDQRVGNIIVGHKPCGIVADKNDRIWILCQGRGFNGFPAVDDTPGRLLLLNADTYEIIRDFTFPDSHLHPDKLAINAAGDQLYYLYPGGVFRMHIEDLSLPFAPHISRQGGLYAMGLDKARGHIYVSDPVDYVQNGWIFRYREHDGLAVDSFKSGIIPGYFSFN